MELTEIITAATEKRVREIVTQAINERPDHYYDALEPTGVERVVARMVEKIAQEEVAKHESEIRAAIIASISGQPSEFEVSAHTRIKLPIREKKY
jgi:hypothetical protein